jgi:hypothetical protein
MIVLSKTGYDRLDMGKNRQDIAFITSKGMILFGDEKRADFDETLLLMNNPVKFVLDGCGSTPHSEVGAALFAQLFAVLEREINEESFEAAAREVMDRLARDIADNDIFRRDNLSFTILACFEAGEEFVVKYCGDGYIVCVTRDGSIETVRLDDAIRREDGEYPTYLVYNYIENRASLPVEYQGGVRFKTRVFSKDAYANVGVATDGLRYVDKLEAVERARWDENLRLGKAKKLSVIINRNLLKFKDDISICM